VLVLLQTVGSKIRMSKSKMNIKSFTIILFVTVSSYFCLNMLEETNTATRDFRGLSSPHSIQELSIPTLYLHDRDDATVVPPEQRKKPSTIRYAAWGSSVTWGSGLEQRETSAYPWVLSQDATNFAIRAGGPQFPAACTSTMTGTGVFDVIVLEYYMMAKSGLQTLARRMRERFPDALIIFMVNWYPLMISRCDDKDCRSTEHIIDYVSEFGFDMKHGGLTDPKMHQLFDDRSKTWSWQPFTQSGFRDVVSAAAQDVGGYVVTMPAPKDPRHWTQYADLFAADGHHLSKKGHKEAAERVREIVEWHGVPRNPRLEKFMYSDHCINWFETGNTDGIEYSNNGVVERMPGTGKFTLSFDDDGVSDNWIKVRNPDDKPLALHLGYMTSGPAPSLYPKTEVIIENVVDDIGSIGQRTDPIVLDMNSEDRFAGRDVHISQIAKVGMINPGDSIVYFRAIEETERPFRLVSVLVMSDGGGGSLLAIGGNLEHAKNQEIIRKEKQDLITK